jgi:hypothetical protein
MVETPKTVVAMVVEVVEVVAVVVEVVETVEIIDDYDAVEDDPADVMDAANPARAADASGVRAADDDAVDKDGGVDAVDKYNGVDADEVDATVDDDDVTMVEVTESAVSMVVEAAKVAEPLVGLGGDRRDDDPSAQGENGQRDRNRLVEKCAHSSSPQCSLVGRPAAHSSCERSGDFKDPAIRRKVAGTGGRLWPVSPHPDH